MNFTPADARPGRVVVFDIGKTNLKLSLLDDDGTPLSEARRANRAVQSGLYPHFDVDAIWDWLLHELRQLREPDRIGSIITTTHGATVALLEDERLALPVLDYEFSGVNEIDAAYASLRDDFGCTYSPALPCGLNVGRQLFWQSRTFPEAFSRVRRILPYPQYWAWRLAGVAAGEITSWGCHTDLWDIERGRLAPMVGKLGWQALFPPLREAGATLGTLLPEVAERTGLPAQCRVVCGIHDSNASLVKHLYGLPAPQAPLNVISSGTWALVAGVGAPLSVLDARRDMLANLDAWGRPVACARFMGGREFAALNAQQADNCDWQDVAALVARGTLALPGFAPLGGGWPERRGEIRGPRPASPEQSYALASLYTALVTDDCLTRLASSGDIVIEGAFTANRHYAALLAALRPEQAVWVSDDRSGTTGGAYLLAARPLRYEPPRARALPRPLAGLPEYVNRWRESVGA